VADNQRIDDLRRRVQKDPASIAFAQLAEECRRAGRYDEAVEVCRAGLAIHPGYLSARVTLGRALIELNEPDEALHELTIVLKSAPENLAAIRGTAEIHHRRGELAEALAQYRAALALARNDPDLQQTVDELARQIEPPPPPASADGLSFEDISSEFLKIAPPPIPAAPAPAAQEDAPPIAGEAAGIAPPAAPQAAIETVDATAAVDAHAAAPIETFAPEPGVAEPTVVTESMVDAAQPPQDSSAHESPADASAARTIAALEQWLDAIHVTRAQRSA
jgi:tetratricopeptide (TPR) repeat protein